MREAAVVVVTIALALTAIAQAQTAIEDGRIDRTIDVQDFDDFEIYLPNTATELSIYAQWSNSDTVILDDVTLLCLSGPNGALTGEDDDLTLSNSRHTSYTIRPGRVWHTMTVSGERCWVMLDFEHKDQFDRSATAEFTIILSEINATEETWRTASATDRLKYLTLKNALTHLRVTREGL